MYFFLFLSYIKNISLAHHVVEEKVLVMCTHIFINVWSTLTTLVVCLLSWVTLCSPFLDSECVVVSDSDPDPKYWIQSLDLLEFDLQTLQKGMDVTGNVINAAQMVLKLQFNVQGLQSTTSTQSL